MKLPLEGIRVCDLSGHASGPMCAMILGDFGAEVIKVEAPRGDHARSWGSARFGKKMDLSSEYAALNRNKESIVIDLKNAEGLTLCKQIIEKSDVVRENFKPGVLARLGLGFEVIEKLNPRAVLTIVTNCRCRSGSWRKPKDSRPTVAALGLTQLLLCLACHLH